MFKLRVKFFAIIFLVNVALFGGHYLFLRMGFEDSFADYMNRRERELANVLAVQLEEYYQVEGSWQEFKADNQRWRQFILLHLRPYFRRLRDDRPVGPPDNNRNFSQDRFDRGRGPGAGMTPLYLLDAMKLPVVGMPVSEDDVLLQPLRVKGKLAGYLGVPLRTEFRDYLDDQFAADHLKHLSVIVIATLLLAFITAIPLSRVMVSRAAVLAGYVRKLSRGNYHDPIRLRGNDELNELAEHLTDLGRTLDKSEQQRKQWVADISHELRTPVAILQADLEAMEDGVRPVDIQAITRLRSQVERLKNLVGDLHNLSLSDLGSQNYRKETCDLKEIVEEAVGLLQDQFEQQQFSLSFHPASQKPVYIFGDRQRLSQLVLNLLQNSLNYTDAPGQAKVALSTQDQQALLEIDDTAPGVDPANQNRLTERLFRVDGSRNRNSGGAGLGLSLCASIVEAHEGKLSFSSSELGGLKVSITIPLTQVP